MSVSSIQQSSSELSSKQISRFWYPIALTWMMMAAEGPAIAAFIARMDDPKINLAAYGIAFSLGLILEAPVIMLMSVSTALVRSRQSLLKLRQFTRFLNGIMTAGMLICLIPGVFATLMSGLRLEQVVADQVYSALIFLLPWPASIGFRRFYQGLIIGHGSTRLITLGTVVRLIFNLFSCVLLYQFGSVSGAELGTIALSIGVISEALAIYWFSRSVRYQIMNEQQTSLKEDLLTYRRIFKVYIPLALSTIVVLCIQPMITFFVSFCRSPLESLAVLPVINSFMFIFRCLALSWQDVVIALIGDKYEGFPQLQKFGFKIMTGILSFLLIISFSPLGDMWFRNIAGLSEDLVQMSRTPLKILILVPCVSVMMSAYRAVAIKMEDTLRVTWATILEISTVPVVMYLGGLEQWTGVMAGAMAVAIGRSLSSGFLIWGVREKVNRQILLYKKRVHAKQSDDFSEPSTRIRSR